MQAHSGRERQAPRAFALGMFALVASMLLALFSGETPIRPSSFLSALLARDGAADARTLAIVGRIRLPRILLAAGAGGSLGLAGALMQSILANPLASPFTLGVSSAAGFGASLAIVAGKSLATGAYAVTANAFIFAAGASLCVYAAAALLGSSPLVLVLAGMGANFLFSSLTTLLHYFSSPEAVYRAMFWIAGSLAAASWGSVIAVSVTLVVSLLVARTLLYDLSLVSEGDRYASAVGVDVRRLRLGCMLLTSLLAAVTVSIVGVIGFVGLVAPHLARALGMDDPRSLVPLSAILGAALLVLADILATRIIAPIVLPIGAVTSLLGIVIFATLLAIHGRAPWKA